MNHARRVSIIINNYNYGHFLQAAIESALGQTYSNVEVIVVDDGSTDNSSEILATYGDQLLAIVKENGGQASAMNVGFTHSHGDIVIFLDSDDVLLPNTAQRMADVFDATPDVVKVMYRMEVIDASGKRTGIMKPSRHLPLRSGDLRQHVLAFPFDMTWMATSGNAFAAEVLHKVLPIPEDAFPILADYYLAHVTPLFGRIVFLNTVGAYYRVHGSNNFELSHASINLKTIRQTIIYSYRTITYIQKFGKQLGLTKASCTTDDLLSVSILAQRMVSLKLDPANHPIKEDTVQRLFWLSVWASLRRFDVSLGMRILYLLWFLAMVLAPKPCVRWLAQVFSFPEKREQINKLLKLLHRSK